MAKIRDILGDDLDLLKAAGASDEKIIQLAKTKYKYYKEMKNLNKYNQTDENGNIVEKKMDDTADFIGEKQKEAANPKETRTLNSFGEGQSFLDRVDRGVVTSGAEIANLAQFAATGKPNKTLSKIINDSRAMDEAYTASQQDPIRRAETEALNAELAKAKGFSETAKAGAKLLLDKAAHPGEWNVAGTIGELANPVNTIGLGSHIVARKLGTGLASKAMIGAGTGATTQGAVNAGYEYGVAKSTGKSDEEANKGAIVGGLSGAAMGGVFGSVAGGMAKSVKPKIETTIKAKKAEEKSSEDINNKIYTDATGKEVPDDVFDELLNNELLQIDEVEQHAAQAEPIIDQISTQAQTPEQINAMVAQYAPPTKKEMQLTLITNDGQEVSPRFAGARVRDSLIKSIANPRRSPGEMYSVLKNEGFSDEKANAIVQSYAAGDISIFDDYVSQKIADAIDVDIVEKTKQLELKNDRVRTEGKDRKRDAGTAKSGPNADTTTTGAKNESDAKQAALQGGERGGGEAIRDNGLDTGKSGKAAGVLDKNAKMAGHETTGSDRTAVPGRGTDEVVPDENAVHTGGGLGSTLDELSKHRKFEQHLKDRENVSAKDIRYGSKQLSKRGVTKGGEAYGGTKEHNYLSDFELTKADVKAIRNGTANEAQIEKLKNDLGRYDNDPAYYDVEKKMDEAHANLDDDEGFAAFSKMVDEFIPKEEPKPKTEPSTRKVVGENVAGQKIFEDEHGVRYVVDGNIRRTEPVSIVPGEGVSTRPTATKPDDFLTKGEYEELYGQTAEEDHAAQGGDTVQPDTKTAQKTEAADKIRARIEKLQNRVEGYKEKQKESPSDAWVFDDKIKETEREIERFEEALSKQHQPGEESGNNNNETNKDRADNGDQAGEDVSKEYRDEAVADVPEPPKTKGERKAINARVEEIIKKPVEEVTPEEKKILENYTGKGALESGTKESLTQYYTDSKTVDAIYKALEDAGVKVKTALEPAVGSGNFLKGRKGIKFSTVDIDKINHEVVKRLYPDAEHYLGGYESYKPKEKFDLIISNVPFSEERGAGRLAHRPDVKALHDHFFVKALEDVKDDGVVAFITSKGVMDKANPKIRKEITRQADVIGAYRLPDNAFKHTHTNVVTDVIFLQKRPKGAESRMEFANRAFETASKDDNGITMSDYYRKYPDHVLGEMKAGIDPMFGKPTYLIKGDADLSKMKINYKPYREDGKVSSGSTKQAGKGSAGDKSASAAPKKQTLSDKKVELLKQIKETLDPELVKEYKKRYKKHPLKDRGLKARFKENMDDLYELSSYFDEDFNPAEIFYKEARYSGSGKIKVTERSPLKERLIYNEDAQGIIDTKSAKFLHEDIDAMLDAGYAYIGEGKIQNDVLYYSGNIYKKIDEAKKITDRDVSAQIATLEEVVPPRKTLEQMTFKGNEPWLLDAGIKIFRLERKSKWVKIPNNGGERKVYEWVSQYGTVFDNYLNNRKLISAKDMESETAFKRRMREAETRVKDVLQEIKQKAEAQRAEIEEVYNRKYNFYRAPDYSKLEYMIADALAELPKGFSLRQTQKKFIIKALYEGKGINAHDVGGGKTFAGIVLGRTLKQKGIAKKPLYVVPAKVIKNWQKEILELYPNAKIVNLGNLNKATRTKKLFALSNENADFVLISQEGFKELKLPLETEKKYAKELFEEYQKNDDLKGNARAKQDERIKMYMAALAKANEDKRITLDKLGIDAIIADEARAFKNIGVRSSLARLGLGKPFGMTATKKSIAVQSAKAYDFRFKTRYIAERNNQKNIYMLDATPTPNKPLELFTMLKHLDNHIFDEYGIKTDEDFVNQFLETGTVQQKSGGFKEGITGIKNVFELRSIMDRFIDRISMQEFKEKGYIKIPESKVYRHIIESSDENDIVFSDIHDRLAEAKSDSSKRKDVLGIYSNGVTASVDPRLYAKEGITELAHRTPENNKIDAVVKLVSEARKKDKSAGEIIFVDNAGHSAEHLDHNLHQEIKDKLVEEVGYKKEEVAIISGQEITNVKTGREQKASGNRMSDMKQEIVNAYNAGKVKVVIGTTKSAGEGMNIQKYTKDIYHIDLPWTPAEITQRNGRGVRYGNINPEVNIHYFFTQGSFDDLMFNTVTKKQGWNDLIWDAQAKATLKVADSEGGGLPSPDEIMLAMEKDPVKRKMLELKIEHERIEENFTNTEDEVRWQQGRLAGITADISSLRKRLERIREEIKSGNIDTKEIRDLAIKAAKDPAKYRKRYNEKLEQAISLRKSMLEVNEGRLKKMIASRNRTLKDLETAKADHLEAQKRLERFEEENIAENGEYKTGLEEC